MFRIYIPTSAVDSWLFVYIFLSSFFIVLLIFMWWFASNLYEKVWIKMTPHTMAVKKLQLITEINRWNDSRRGGGGETFDWFTLISRTTWERESRLTHILKYYFLYLLSNPGYYSQHVRFITNVQKKQNQKVSFQNVGN